MRSSSIVLAVSLFFLGTVEHMGTVPAVRSSRSTEGLSSGASPALTILLTGDILLDRGVRQVINRHGVDHLFSDGIDSVFREAQIVVGNLECPATKIEAPRLQTIHLPSRTRMAQHFAPARLHSPQSGKQPLYRSRPRRTRRHKTEYRKGWYDTHRRRPEYDRSLATRPLNL